MADIIEQQDLLKGLPDARLAMLLQNPVGDIPPFLVAAEAQRRQSIRQQFAGQPSNESVVDTLTKQLSKVPQNLNTPMQSPPMIPPTPPMEGVAALQAQQAMQAGQQPQQMRRGGMVQRYQYGGQVQPWWEIPDISGGVANAAGYVGGKVSDLADWATTPFSEREAEEEEKKREENRIFPDLYPGSSGGMSFTPALPKTEKPRPPKQTEEDPQPGETEDEFRARLEAFYAAREPSDWEKSQRWFAMAEQFLDPSKTTMQSVAGAGRAFAEQSAAMDAAKREAEIAREKGMLEYDIAKAEELRAGKVREAEAKAEALKARTDIATGQLDDLRRERRDIAERIKDIKTNAINSGLVDDPVISGQIETLQNAYDELGSKISTYEKFISETYGFPLIETADLSNGQILPPRK